MVLAGLSNLALVVQKNYSMDEDHAVMGLLALGILAESWQNIHQASQDPQKDSQAGQVKRKRRWWTRPIYREETRKQHGDYHNLMTELVLSDDNVKYWRFLRMDKEGFMSLLERAKPLITKQDTKFRKAIEPSVRLAITLRYLAEGLSHDDLSFGFRVGKSTVSKIVRETCNALVSVLKPEFMPNLTSLMWKKVATGFETKWNFPHCVGAIDGKHVAIECPSLSGSEFRNYKSFFSIVLLALCDADYRFIYLDIGAPGADSDGGIFSTSNLGVLLENGGLGLPAPEAITPGGPEVPYFILGDEAFPSKTYLLRPFPGKKLGRQPGEATVDASVMRKIFNYRQARARRVIENAFGILATKWRIFRKPIAGSHQNITEIVHAACLLHNFMRSRDLTLPAAKRYCPPDYTDSDDVNDGRWRQEDFGTCMHPVGRTSANFGGVNALNVRQVMAEYFVSPEGQLPYQWVYINRGRDA